MLRLCQQLLATMWVAGAASRPASIVAPCGYGAVQPGDPVREQSPCALPRAVVSRAQSVLRVAVAVEAAGESGMDHLVSCSIKEPSSNDGQDPEHAAERQSENDSEEKQEKGIKTGARRVRLKPRQETPGDDANTQPNSEMAPSKATEQKPRGPKPGAKAIELTPEQQDFFRKRHNHFRKKYRLDSKGRAEFRRLKARRGSPEELAEFDALYQESLTYTRWYKHGWNRREQAPLDSPLYTPEDREKVEALTKQEEALRAEAKAFAREFLHSKKGYHKAQRLRAKKGTPEEIARYQAGAKTFSAWRSAKSRLKSVAKLTRVEADVDQVDDVKQLEALRPDFLTYNRKYSGPKNAAKRKRIESGKGSAAEAKRYHALKESWKQYRNIYGKHWRHMRKELAQDPTRATTKGETQVVTRGRGRRRYFHPQDATVEAVVEKSLSSSSSSEEQDLSKPRSDEAHDDTKEPGKTSAPTAVSAVAPVELSTSTSSTAKPSEDASQTHLWSRLSSSASRLWQGLATASSTAVQKAGNRASEWRGFSTPRVPPMVAGVL